MDGAERTVFTAKKGDTGLWQRGPDRPTGARLKREAAKRPASGAENRIFPVAFRNRQSGPERGKACDAKESILTTTRRQRPVRRPRDGAGKPSGARTPGRRTQAGCPMRCRLRCRFSALPHRHHLKKGNFVPLAGTSPLQRFQKTNRAFGTETGRSSTCLGCIIQNRIRGKIVARIIGRMVGRIPARRNATQSIVAA